MKNKIYWRILTSGGCLLILASFFLRSDTEGGLLGALADVLGPRGTAAFLVVSGLCLITYSAYKLNTAGDRYSKSMFPYLSKYYSMRFLAGAFVMGSFAIGFLAGAEYGLSIGLCSFFATLGVGIILHRIADKLIRS